MKHKESGPAVDIRALEGAVMVLIALLAADTFRTAFAPLWQSLRLLFGL